MTRFPHSPTATRITDCDRLYTLRCWLCGRRWAYKNCDQFIGHRCLNDRQR